MESLLHALGIDWKLLVAQIVNFGVLAFLLHRFAFKPLMKTLDERISGAKDAEEKTSSIEEKLGEIKALEEKALAEARETSKRLSAKAEANAASLQKRLEEEARKGAEDLRNSEIKKLEEEKRTFFASLKKEVHELVALSVEKAVANNATPELKAKMSAEALMSIEKFAKHND